MSSSAAAVILAHDHPDHVRRLIGTLQGLDLFLHCDMKTPDDVLAAMVRGRRDVALVPRFRTPRRRWGPVEAELAGLRMALERSSAEHIIVLSGSCYPLVAATDLLDELADWRGISRLELNPIPYAGWNHDFFRDGGEHRFNRRFLRAGGQLVLVRSLPIPVGRRPVPSELRLHATSQWKIYAREHARALLRVVDERPDLVEFWRLSFVPQEAALASILASPALTGAVADQLRHDRTWYIDWRGSEAGGHPRWLDPLDFPALRDARTQAPLRPDDPPSRGEDARKLFARKVSVARSRALLDRIDAELRI